MLWVAVAAGIVLVMTALWSWGSRPSYHRDRTVEQLGHFVDSFLVQMAPGSTLIAQREDGGGFLQLAMRSASATWQSVEFGLPETGWSRGHFDRVLEDLRAHGFPVEVEVGTTADVTRFLRIAQAGEVEPLGRQLHRMLSLTHKALDWPADQRFVVHFEGALRGDRGAMPVRASGDKAV